MISEQAEIFEAECQALYERHKATGFFTFVTDDGRVQGHLRATPDDRVGVLIGAQEINASILARFSRARAAAEASARPRRCTPHPQPDAAAGSQDNS